jgi:hypothetical protein
VDAGAQAFGHLVVDLRAKTRQATKSGLHMSAGAAEPVVKVEVAKGGIKVIDPHQPNHAAAKPDAFGVTSWTVNSLGGFGELVGLALVVLGRVGGVWRPGLARLILGMGVAALGEGVSETEQNNERGNREMAQDYVFDLEHLSTHKFPELSSPSGRAANPPVMPAK